MRRSHLTRRVAESSAIGWISTTDAFLFGIGLLFVIVSLLESEIATKAQDNEVLNKQNDLLISENESLREAAAETLDAQEIQRQLDEALKESKAIQEQLAKLQLEKDALTTDLSHAKAELAAATQLYDDLIDKHNQLIERVKAQIAANKKHLEENQVLLAKLERAKEIFLAHKDQIDALQAQVAALEALKTKFAKKEKEYEVIQANYEATQAEFDLYRSSEKRVRTELIGLRGNMKRVAILFDASGSMKEGGRWENAQRVMSTWLEFLDMEECILIVFSRDTKVFPAGGEFLDVKGDEGAQNRLKLVKFLEEVEPTGGTNTLAALQQAYQLEGLTNIVLFTDGAPNDGKSATFDPEIAEQIYALCRSHKTKTINAIGLGNYFQPEMSAFLLKIAEITEGTFVGR